MRNIISAFLTISFVAVFGAAAFAQTAGLRVEADIPFDFAIGKKTFAKGSYQMVLTRINGSVYSASLRDDDGRVLFTAMAIETGSTSRDISDMVFAGGEGQYLLDKLRTPDKGFQFMMSKANAALVAESKKIPVQTVGAPNF